ncbi:MAG TPA: hypothetical protein VEA19_00390 [Actinomycetota bacterium]|nr:hypothetical protein [Actinomycetota bacterium]
MAIYRPQRPRWRLALIAGLGGLLLGLLLGFLLRPEPDAGEVLGELRSTLASAAGSLEIVEIEYAESVSDGTIVSQPEYEGARSALASSRARFEEAREGLAAVSPDAATRADDGYRELESAITSRAPTDEVSSLVRELRETLTTALGD